LAWKLDSVWSASLPPPEAPAVKIAVQKTATLEDEPYGLPTERLTKVLRVTEFIVPVMVI
jgi:hypothetical protein